MTTEILELPISKKAIRRGDSLYFRPSDAKTLIKQCEKNNLAVIGIEGLTLDETGIQPYMDLIADYVTLRNDWTGILWAEFRSRCNTSALGFIEKAKAEKKPGELVFDFALMRSDEYADFIEERERWIAMGRR